jgi:hypothetical protein
MYLRSIGGYSKELIHGGGMEHHQEKVWPDSKTSPHQKNEDKVRENQ